MSTTNMDIKPVLDKLATNGRYFETLAKKLGANISINMIYGEPVERAGITVIPVGKISYGFGGGESPETANAPGGLGGGVGALAKPVGYIEIKNGKAKFQPIVDVGSLLRTVFIFVIVVMLVGSSIQKRKAKLTGKAGKAKTAKEDRDTFNFGLLNVINRQQVRPNLRAKERRHFLKVAKPTGLV